jgi:hypothetical protein
MRPRVKPQVRLGALLALGVLVAGCTSWPEGGDCDAAGYERDLQSLRGEIDREIGEAEATDEAACRTLPLGAKPCGGPWTYLVYSAEASNSDRLDALAADYDRIDSARNRACGLASTCEVTAAPTPVLADGRCVAGGGR